MQLFSFLIFRFTLGSVIINAPLRTLANHKRANVKTLDFNIATNRGDVRPVFYFLSLRQVV